MSSRALACAAALLAFALGCGCVEATSGPPPPPLRVEPEAARLVGPLAGQQLVVSEARGAEVVDRTRRAVYVVSDPRVARVDADGLVVPVGPGVATISARFGGHVASMRVEVASSSSAPRFRVDVEPILAKAGCNGGPCHGSFAGKGGLRLSLFGHDAAADHAALASRTGIVLQKIVGDAGHGGGKRVEPNSQEFRTVAAWIAGGAALDPAADEPVEVEIAPRLRTLALGASPEAQEVVTAVFADGHREDVTRAALFKSQNPDVADAVAGRVRAARPGATTIVASYLGKFAVASVLVPRPGDGAAARAVPHKTLVDDHVLARLEALHVTPAARADDGTFLRRVMLDLIGTLPTAVELAAFARDGRPDKRERLVDGLLARPEYADWWATKLCEWMGADDRFLGRYPNKSAYAWWSWVRARVAKNQPYDAMVRDILLATGREGRTWEAYLAEAEREEATFADPLAWETEYPKRKTLDIFWTKAVNRAPEVVAQEVSYAFLGVHIDCAQCHKHPFDRWTQRDFWKFSALFSRVKVGYPADVRSRYPGARPPMKEVFVASGGADPYAEVVDPKTRERLVPAVLGGRDVKTAPGRDPREELARWVTAPDNPYFARALVNRVFAQHFGRGLVEPTDALSAANPPSDPALLDALAKDFVASGFDMKHLHRVMLESSVYGLDARPREEGDDARLFSHYVVRRLPAEVLVDAVNQVTGREGTVGDVFAPPGVRAIAFPSSRPRGAISKVFGLFGRPLRAAANDCERDDAPSLPQAVFLMNDGDLLDKVRGRGGRLGRLLEGTATDAAIVDELAIAALARPLTPKERAGVLAKIATWQEPGAGRPKDEKVRRREALEDAALTVLGLAEFQTNH